MHLQDEVGSAGVAVAVVELVGEGFSAVAPAIQGDKLWVGFVQGVDIAAVGKQLQRAVGADNRVRRDGPRGDAVCALHVIAQHAAAQGELAFRGNTRRAVIDRLGHIVDHTHVQGARSAAVVAVGGGHRKRLADAIGIRAGWVAVGAVEGVAVADHAGAGVVAGDGQGIAQASRLRLRERRGDAVGDDTDTAHREVLQAVQCSHRKSTGLGQRRPIDSAAQWQVFLVDRDFPAIHFQAGQHHRIVVVMHLQDEVGSAGVAVGIRQGVGKRLRPIPATVQRQEVAVGRVQRVHISAIRGQFQRAIQPREGARRHRPGRHPICALHVIGQHRAAEDQQAFGRHLRIVVIGGRRHIVHHTDMQGARGRAVVGVAGDHAEAFGQLIHPTRGRVRLGVGQGVAVADHPGGRVKAGDGQGIAQACGDRLREAGDNTAGHYVDAPHRQVLQTVHC